MICSKCKELMNYISGNQNGGYYICTPCNNVTIK